MTGLRSEGGVAAVEASIVMSLLIVLSIGIVEGSFLILDQLAVGNATREGARVGAIAGTEPNADDLIIDVVEQALCSLVNGSADKVLIFEADASGSVPGHPSTGDPYYAVYDTGLVNEFTPSGSRTCANGRVVPDFAHVGGSWAPAGRDDQLPGLDEVGVLVLFSHDDLTGLLPIFQGDTYTQTTVMRIEPEVNA